MSNRKAFRTILRYSVQPGFNEETAMNRLVEFCKYSRIDEVMLFLNFVDVYMGHMDQEGYKPWLDMIQRWQPKLEKNGIAVSINPQSTIGQYDNGAKLLPDQDFQMMVDQNGREAELAGCPLDPKFQKYLGDIFGYFATVNPKVVWLEDDFRYHNHRPLEFGGCFCPLHMAAFSEKLGRKVDREEFVNGLLQPGPCNEYRRAWLEVQRDSMVKLAQCIGEGVRSQSAETALGLMSSFPSTHCMEGRDWDALIKGMGAGLPGHSRPHLPAYVETTALDYLFDMMNKSVKTVVLCPEGTQIYPELENCPWSSYSKSDSFTGFQMETAAAFGADGVAANLFDMSGNGVDLTEDCGDLLCQNKDYLDAVARLDFNPRNMKGVVCLFSDKSSFTLVAPEGNQLSKLEPAENFWAGALPCFGIAAVPSLDYHQKGKVVAISGQYLRNLTNDEITRLFSDNFILLDGVAAMTLIDMGLGELAGMDAYEILPEWYSGHSYEEVCNGHIYSHFERARMTAVWSAFDYTKIHYTQDPYVITNMMRFDGTVTGVGMAVSKGCLVLPYVYGQIRPYATFSNVRRDIIAEVLSGKVAMTGTSLPGMAVFMYDNAVVVANAHLDDVKTMDLYIPGYEGCKVSEITRSGAREPVGSVDGNSVLRVPGITKCLSTRTFVFEEKINTGERYET